MKKPSSKNEFYKRLKPIKKDPKGCAVYSDIKIETYDENMKLVSTKIQKGGKIKKPKNIINKKV